VATPDDADLVSPLLVTFLRLWSTASSRRYAPPALLLDSLASAYTCCTGFGDASISRAVRARWAAARHLLVTVARSHAGLLALAGTQCLRALLALLLADRYACPQLGLAVLRLVVELLCPPGAAAREAVTDLNGRAPVSRKAHSLGANGGAATGIVDDGYAQALALAHAQHRDRVSQAAAWRYTQGLLNSLAASTARSPSAATLQGGVMSPLDMPGPASAASVAAEDEARRRAAAAAATGSSGSGGRSGGASGHSGAAGSSGSSGGPSHAPQTSAMDSAHAGGASAALGASSGPSSQPQSGVGSGSRGAPPAGANATTATGPNGASDTHQAAGLLPIGFAVPFFTVEARHEVDDEPEFHASFWGKIGEAAAVMAHRNEGTAALHARQAGLGLTLTGQLGTAGILSEERSLLSAAGESSQGNLAVYVTPMSFLQSYRAHMLVILLQSGLIQALSVACMSPHPVLAQAALATLRYVISLGALLLPPNYSENLWNLPDLTSLAAVATARSAMPSAAAAQLRGLNATPILPSSAFLQMVSAAYGPTISWSSFGTTVLENIGQAGSSQSLCKFVCGNIWLANTREAYITGLLAYHSHLAAKRWESKRVKECKPSSGQSKSSKGTKLDGAHDRDSPDMATNSFEMSAAAPAPPVHWNRGIPPPRNSLATTGPHVLFPPRAQVDEFSRSMLMQSSDAALEIPVTAADDDAVRAHRLSHAIRYDAKLPQPSSRQLQQPRSSYEDPSVVASYEPDRFDGMERDTYRSLVRHGATSLAPNNLKGLAYPPTKYDIISAAPIDAEKLRNPVVPAGLGSGVGLRITESFERSEEVPFFAHSSTSIGVEGRLVVSLAPSGAGNSAPEILFRLHSMLNGHRYWKAPSALEPLIVASTHFSETGAPSAASRAAQALRTIDQHLLHNSPSTVNASLQNRVEALAALRNFYKAVAARNQTSSSTGGPSTPPLTAGVKPSPGTPKTGGAVGLAPIKQGNTSTGVSAALISPSKPLELKIPQSGIGSAAALLDGFHCVVPGLPDTHPVRAGVLHEYFSTAATAISASVSVDAGIGDLLALGGYMNHSGDGVIGYLESIDGCETYIYGLREPPPKLPSSVSVSTSNALVTPDTSAQDSSSFIEAEIAIVTVEPAMAAVSEPTKKNTLVKAEKTNLASNGTRIAQTSQETRSKSGSFFNFMKGIGRGSKKMTPEDDGKSSTRLSMGLDTIAHEEGDEDQDQGPETPDFDSLQGRPSSASLQLPAGSIGQPSSRRLSDAQTNDAELTQRAIGRLSASLPERRSSLSRAADASERDLDKSNENDSVGIRPPHLGFIQTVFDGQDCPPSEAGARDVIVTSLSNQLGINAFQASVLVHLRNLQTMTESLPLRYIQLTYMLQNHDHQSSGPDVELLITPSIFLAGLNGLSFEDAFNLFSGARESERPLHTNQSYSSANIESNLLLHASIAGNIRFDQAFRAPPRPGQRLFLASYFRRMALQMPHAPVLFSKLYNSGTSAANNPIFRPLRERDSVLAARVSEVMNAIRASRVCSVRDWRLWDWGLVSVVLDHYLTSPPLFCEVVMKTQFMQRLGDVFGRISLPADLHGEAGSLSLMAWLPASVRFMRAARQWLLLCIHNPLGRDVLRKRGQKGQEMSGQGIIAEVAVALWCQMSKVMFHYTRMNASFGRPTGGLGTKLLKAFGGGQNDAAQESAVSASIRSLIGTGTDGEAVANVFNRNLFTTTLSREYLSLIGALTATEKGREMLLSLRATTFLGIPDAPFHQLVLASIEKATGAPLPRSIRESRDSILLTLLHLPTDPSKEYLARHLLLSLNFDTYLDDGPAWLLLRVWLSCPRGRELSLEAERVGLKDDEAVRPRSARDAIASWRRVGGAPPGKPQSGRGLMGTPARQNSDGKLIHGEGLLSALQEVGDRDAMAFAVSQRFNIYCVNFLRVLLRRSAPGFSEWGIELAVRMMAEYDYSSARAALSVITEAAMRSRVYLLSIISRKPTLRRFHFNLIAPLCTLMLSEPSGLVVVARDGLLNPLLSLWVEVEHIRYSLAADSGLLSLFQTCAVQLDEKALTTVLQRDNTDALQAGETEGSAAAVGDSAQVQGSSGSATKWTFADRTAVSLLPRVDQIVPSTQSHETVRYLLAIGGSARSAEAAEARAKWLASNTATWQSRLLKGATVHVSPALFISPCTVSEAASSLARNIRKARHDAKTKGIEYPGATAAGKLFGMDYGYRPSAAAILAAAVSPTLATNASASFSRKGRGKSTSSSGYNSRGSSRERRKSVASSGNSSRPGSRRGSFSAVDSSDTSSSSYRRRSSSSVSVRSTGTDTDPAERSPSLFASEDSDISGSLYVDDMPPTWPIPLRLPSTAASVTKPQRHSEDAVQLYFEALQRGDSAYSARLDALLQLPWRVEVWVETEGGNRGDMPRAARAGSSFTDLSPIAPATSSYGTTMLSASPAQAPASFGSFGNQAGGAPSLSADRSASSAASRVEVICDTYVDLTSFAPELRGDGMSGHDRDDGRRGSRPFFAPDCYVRGECMDRMGKIAPIILSTNASIKAALYCGTYPVSPLGEIPFSAVAAQATSSTGTTSTGVTASVYESPTSILQKLGAASQWASEAAIGPEVKAAPQKGVPVKDSTAASMWALLGSDAASNELGPETDVAIMDEAATRLRRRNAAAVASLTPGKVVRHSNAWAAECNLVQPENSTQSRPRSSSLSDLQHVTGGQSSATLLGSVRMPDTVGQGPEAATTILSGQVLSSQNGDSLTASLRASGDKHSLWTHVSLSDYSDEVAVSFDVHGTKHRSSTMDTDSSAPAHGPYHGRIGDHQLPDQGPVLTPEQGQAAPERAPMSRFVKCPPGSNARFIFSTPTSDDAAGTVMLEAVEFGITLLPKAAAEKPLPLHLFSVLAAHEDGAALLRSGGLLAAMVDVAFNCVRTPFGGHPAEEDAKRSVRHPKNAIMQRRAALCAIGMAASTPAGFRSLKSTQPDILLHLDALARGLRLFLDISTEAPQVKARTPSKSAKDSAFTPAPSGERFSACRYVALPSLDDDTSLRFAAMQTLSMIARHKQGLAEVTALGWAAIPQPADVPAPMGFTGASGSGTFPIHHTIRPVELILFPQVPTAGYSLLHVSGPSVIPAVATESGKEDRLDDIMNGDGFLCEANLPPIQQDWETVLRKITELSSRISQKDARSAILHLRSEKPELFASSGLYMHVHALLSRYNLPLPVRRFVHTLFERVSFSDKAWTFST
jgi:uncharacterized membrane protein YgcG